MRDASMAGTMLPGAQCDLYHDLPPGLYRVNIAQAGIDSAAAGTFRRPRMVEMDADQGAYKAC